MCANHRAFALLCPTLLLVSSLNLSGCTSPTPQDEEPSETATDITNKIFVKLSNDCRDYVDDYQSNVKDIQRNVAFTGTVGLTAGETNCTVRVNGIPNHSFNDETASFFTAVQEVSRTFTIPRSPSLAQQTTRLSQSRYDAIMLNGVVVDLLSAGCYRPTDPKADQNGNVAVGCQDTSPWLRDPLGPGNSFGADIHNAHTQPDGTYHYHGSPNAMFDDKPGSDGSPLIGFAADGFPIFGSYFKDPATGTVRKATSGYTLKAGARPARDNQNPGGLYTGMYIDDYEFTDAGDLDACNGMTVNGVYGYYVTDTYPWVLACHSGTPHASFSKTASKALWLHSHE